MRDPFGAAAKAAERMPARTNCLKGQDERARARPFFGSIPVRIATEDWIAPMLRIPHNAFVFVGDGTKALVLRNEGDAQILNLKTERVFTAVNPPTHEQGTDRPGRAFSSVGAGRSSVTQTDWHQLEEHRFVEQVAAT